PDHGVDIGRELAEAVLALPQRGFGPRPSDGLPGPLGRLLDERQLLVMPMAWLALIGIQRRGEPPVLDERYQDRGTIAVLDEGGGMALVRGPRIRQGVVDADDLSRPQFANDRRPDFIGMMLAGRHRRRGV